MLATIAVACGGRGDDGIVAPGFELVTSAWEASSDLHEPGDAVELAAVERAGRALGRDLPSDLVALYRYANGGGFLESNLILEPVEGLLQLNDDPHRPSELLLFASDGSDSLFGVWAPEGAGEASLPIVEYDPGGGGLALAGTMLSRFLVTRTAYYLMLYEADHALDALGVPERLRHESEALDDESFRALAGWADPMLPLEHEELYDPGITVDELRRRYGADPS